MKFEEFEKLKKFEENSLAIALNLLYAKKYFLLMFQNIKISYSFNDYKRRIMALFCSKNTISIINMNNFRFYCLDCLHSFRTKTNLSRIKGYVEVKIFVI